MTKNVRLALPDERFHGLGVPFYVFMANAVRLTRSVIPWTGYTTTLLLQNRPIQWLILATSPVDQPAL